MVISDPPTTTLLTEATRVAVATEAARLISDAIRRSVVQRGSASVALSGGSTPRDTYVLLAKTPSVDWSKVDAFWVDERAVGPGHERSNYGMAKSALIGCAGFDLTRVHRMQAERPDLERAALEYESLLRAYVELDDTAVPSLDVMVLGIGPDGHTASLFPGEPTVEETVALVRSVPALGLREARLTVTRPIIEHARNVFVLVVGSDKRAATARVLGQEGDLQATPARVLRQCHGSVTWIMDRDASPLEA